MWKFLMLLYFIYFCLTTIVLDKTISISLAVGY
jgi:hypothetical protein